MALSPMMAEYLKTKEQYKDCLLFYRLGDFYEMFYDDAKLASKELELALTGRSCGLEEKAPMCGVPFHAVDTYISKLVEKGYKVAICEQMEDPQEAKGIVKREVVQVVTPGTLTSQAMLKEKENNYLASIYATDEGFGLSYSDISTGELYATQVYDSNYIEILLNELVKIKPREILINEDKEYTISESEIADLSDIFINKINSSTYTENSAVQLIKAQFNCISLTGIGLEDKDLINMSLCGLFTYLLDTQKQNLNSIIDIQIYQMGKHMSLDKATLRNLEITETLYEKKVQGSLLGVLDKTKTAMGSRKLKQWLREPLNNLNDIQNRLDTVEELVDKPLIQNNINEYLKQIYDFQRLAGRIACGNANGKDLIALRNSIAVLPNIKEELTNCDTHLLKEINDNINDLKEVHSLIENSIVEEPPFTVKEGGLIKQGFSKELDDLKFSIKDGKEWISNLENKERQRTGISKLKVGFNKVFGYYIEITKSNLDMVPENYIRKQTLVNAERFITPELKEMESLVLNAETKINKTEYQLFTSIRDEISKYIKTIQLTSQAISMLDVLRSFAEVATKNDYVKPSVNDMYEIIIEKGRHPVIEQTVENGLFVSNDTYINNTDSSMLLITGPNMSGKSTYMRQTALIVLMAQAGCFVPCASAKIGICDRIFTRIGASDNLAQGQSTFFVEMNELAYILNNSTDKSLVILDEIGRGTSTYDGLSIAWAVVEYLCNTSTHIRTLFATHYHELTQLESKVKGVKNLNVDVHEENGNIVFLHKIVPGSASRSYGIHVAKLAGIPNILLDNAQNKLNSLEKDKDDIDLSEAKKTYAKGAPSKQISFFDFAPHSIVQKLRDLNLLETTPSEAFKVLEDLKKTLLKEDEND